MGVCVGPDHVVFTGALRRTPPAARFETDSGASLITYSAYSPNPMIFEDSTSFGDDTWFETDWLEFPLAGEGVPGTSHKEVRMLLDGWYYVEGCIRWDAAAPATIPFSYNRLMIYQNGTAVATDTVKPSASIDTIQTVQGITKAKAGDLFALYYQADFGGRTIQNTNNYTPSFAITRLGGTRG